MEFFNKLILLKFVTGQLLYTPTKSLSIKNIEIDKPEEINDGIYWKAKIQKYIKQKNTLAVKILGLGKPSEIIFENQEQLFENVILESIKINSIPTNILLSSKTITSQVFKKNNPRLTPEIEFEVNFLKIKFEDGFFQIKKIIPKISPEELIINVYNEYSKKEYNAVKDYFAKRIGKKVKVKLKITDRKAKESIGISIDLNKINDSLIESVYNDYLKNSIFSQDEENKVIKPLDDLVHITDQKGNNIKVFDKSIDEIYEDLIKDSKHYKYLRYLSKRHVSKVMRLRSTNNPFSFFFLIEGLSRYYFIWETLDTEEATYIWGLKSKNSSSVKLGLSNLDSDIERIKDQGKRSYLASENSSGDFDRIYHKYTEGEKGVLQWKNDLKKILKNDFS